MTEAARWNLQHGIPEDRTKEWTDYTPTSNLDRYILHKVKMREKYLQQQKEIQDQKDLEDQIEKKVTAAIDKAFADLFKNFK